MSRRTSNRSAHTLLELMVALPLMAAIVAAAGGLIAAANSAKSLSNGLLADRTESVSACQRIVTDMQFALSVADISPNSIEFSTADRDGDNIPDDIRYSWSGVSGDPVTFSLNGSTPEVVVDNVHQFVTSVEKSSSSEETLIKYHDDSPGGEFRHLQITTAVWAAQYLEPDVPAAATQYSIHRVRLLLRSVGQKDGQISVSIAKSHNTGIPTDSIYETRTIDESDLDTEFAWVDFHFAHVDNISTSQKPCIVVAAESGSDAVAEIAYETSGSSMTEESHWLTSTNAGLTWSVRNSTEDMKFYVIGEHDSTATSRTAYDTFRLALQVGDNETALTSGSGRFFNQPEADPEFIIMPTD